MRTILTILLACSFIILSCTKSNDQNINSAVTPKLKTILYQKDTVVPLCAICVPVVTQGAENFIYDNYGRLIERILTSTVLTNNPVTTDTLMSYKYSYSGPNISNYSQRQNNVVVNHILIYDSQNRLLLDSVLNPQTSNNKVTHLMYLQDTIIQISRLSFPAASCVSIDTMLITGNNIAKETIHTTYSNGGTNYRELTYFFTPYQNPLSYVNNFQLFSSDYKNSSTYFSFLISDAQNVTYNLTSQRLTLYSNNMSPITMYSTFFNATLDSIGRVETVNDVTNNRKTKYLYY